MMKYLSIICFSFSILIFPVAKVQAQTEKDTREFKKNTLYFSMSDVIFKRVSFEYERVIGEEGVLSINIPFSFSFGDANTMYKSLINSEFQNISFKYMVDFSDWYIGLGANFYPVGQGVASFYFGPQIRLGPAHRYPDEYYYEYYYTYDEDDNQYSYREQEYLQTTFLLNIGGSYQAVENFTISLNLGVGLSSSIDNSVVPAILPSFNMGLKF